MTVANTSLKAYRELKNLGRDQQIIHNKVDEFEHAGAYGLPSRRDLATALGWETSRVAARVNDIIRYGYLKEHGTKIDRITGRTVKCLVTASPVDNKVVKQAAVGWLRD